MGKVLSQRSQMDLSFPRYMSYPPAIGKVLLQRLQIDIPCLLVPLEKSCHKDHEWIYPVSSCYWKSLVTKITNGFTQSPPTIGKVFSQRSQIDLPCLLLPLEKSCHKDHKWIYPVSFYNLKSLVITITNGYTQSPPTIGKVLSQRSQMDLPSLLLLLEKS